MSKISWMPWHKVVEVRADLKSGELSFLMKSDIDSTNMSTQIRIADSVLLAGLRTSYNCSKWIHLTTKPPHTTKRDML